MCVCVCVFRLVVPLIKIIIKLRFNLWKSAISPQWWQPFLLLSLNQSLFFYYSGERVMVLLFRQLNSIVYTLRVAIYMILSRYFLCIYIYNLHISVLQARRTYVFWILCQRRWAKSLRVRMTLSLSLSSTRCRVYVLWWFFSLLSNNRFIIFNNFDAIIVQSYICRCVMFVGWLLCNIIIYVRSLGSFLVESHWDSMPH